MTKEQQRIKIAEFSGFAFVRSEMSGGIEQWHDPDGEIVHLLPNYSEDLNAMALAESGLTPVQRAAYIQLLESICEYDVIASAAQRAEAFCQVITNGLNPEEL